MITAAKKEILALVDPTIGTVGSVPSGSAHGGGKTHPGACHPFGMVQLAPDTVTGGDNGTGYNYCHRTIEGFSFNHMSGIGWYGDLGNLQIMPIVGEGAFRSGSNREVPFAGGTGWKSAFDHKNEIARPGYYSVLLDRYGIGCEATVSCHTGQLRFTYPPGGDHGLIFNFSRRIAGRAAAQAIRMDGQTISGCITCDHRLGGFGRGEGGIDYRFYFCLELSAPVRSAQFFEWEQFCTPGETTRSGEDLHLLVRLGDTGGVPVLLRCGISYTSAEGAARNLQQECPSFDFDGMAKRTADAWADALSCIDICGGNDTDRTLFYTCLYHTLLDPRTATDTDGHFADRDGTVRLASYNHRTMFSGWDVYRSEFPLLTLISPITVRDTVRSLLHIARTGHRSFPRWELMGTDSGCMVGDPGTIVMADAYLKGIRDFDVSGAWAIARASAQGLKILDGMPFHSIRPDSETYLRRSYVPGDLSSTLEYLMADYALYRMAEALAKEERMDIAAGSLGMPDPTHCFVGTGLPDGPEEAVDRMKYAADAAYFYDRATRYGENYNPALGFMAPRDEDGAFLPVRDRYDTTGCVESNIFQQSMFVPWDVPGLAHLFGRERLISLLEELFERADLTALWNENYNHSNEPCHNLTHYFAMLGQPERTQYWTRRVQKEAYRLGAFGFCGNEDVGQLSAWYVLSAMGFAQICMGDDKYVLNTPLFEQISLKLTPEYHACTVDHTFTVRCDRNPQEFPYIAAARLNGQVLDRLYVTYGEITAGGVLELSLKKEPYIL